MSVECAAWLDISNRYGDGAFWKRILDRVYHEIFNEDAEEFSVGNGMRKIVGQVHGDVHIPLFCPALHLVHNVADDLADINILRFHFERAHVELGNIEERVPESP